MLYNAQTSARTPLLGHYLNLTSQTVIHNNTPKPQIEEPQQEEQKFQIEIIDRLGKNRNLDKAIKR